ncbi:MAG: hypothetical protein J7L88_01910 [Thermoplasmata archaeon]|nr:hypothetical protein [Thermoplasmata archaeon]
MTARGWCAQGIVTVAVLLVFLSAFPLISAGVERTRAPPLLSGSITEDTVLDAGSYRLGNLTIESGANVYVPKGTEFYFNSTSRITVKGRLVLDGIEGSGITFVPITEGTVWHGIEVAGGTLILNYTTIEGASRAIAALQDSTLLLRASLINNTDTGVMVAGADVVNIFELGVGNVRGQALYMSGDGYEVQSLKVRRCEGEGIVLENVNNSIFRGIDLKVDGRCAITVTGSSRNLTIMDFYLTPQDESNPNPSGIHLTDDVMDVLLSEGNIEGARSGILSSAKGEVRVLNTTISADKPLNVLGSGTVNAYNCNFSGSPSISVENDSAEVNLYSCTFSDVDVRGEDARVTSYYDVHVKVVDEPLNSTLEGVKVRITSGEGVEMFNGTLESGVVTLTLPTDLWRSDGKSSPFNPYTFYVCAGLEPYTNRTTLTEEIHGPDEVVIYVNLPPTFSGEREVTFEEDSYLLLNLSQLFSDPEGENLTFSAEATQNLSASINDTLLNISSKENYFGVEHLTILAVDESGARTRVVLTVNVTAVNDPPYLNTPEDWNITVRAGENYTLNLSAMIGDIDTPIENLSVRIENCTYATVNGTLVTFFFPVSTEINTTYAVVVVSDGMLEATRLLRIRVESGGAGEPETGVNITYAEVTVKKSGEWEVEVKATPNSTIYIVIDGVGSFKLEEKSPGDYSATIPKEKFDEGKKYRYHFSDSEGGEDIAPTFSGEVKQPEEKKGLGLTSYAIVAVIALIVLGVLIYLFTRGKEEEIEE